MNRRSLVIVVIGAAIGVAGAYLAAGGGGDDATRQEVFHATLADPALYKDGLYKAEFQMAAGEYLFDFVPNGSSPETLTITLMGDGLDFSEEFRLEGTRHEAGLGEYYTWEYLGEDAMIVWEATDVSIVVDPNGNTMGSVSVYLLKN